VIATDVGAASEVIIDGESGFIVRGYDKPSQCEGVVCEIAERIREYHRDRSMLLAHGAHSAAAVTQQFRWEDRAPEWIREMLP
jgi:glycosyltransferase involved in cell wall biosynthesis